MSVDLNPEFTIDLFPLQGEILPLLPKGEILPLLSKMLNSTVTVRKVKFYPYFLKCKILP